MDTRPDIAHPDIIEAEAGLARGIFFGLVFVAPFWICLAALLAAAA